jgi:transcription antitermination factor NusG
MDEALKKWFVIQTRPNFEKKVAHQIELKNIEIFLPLITTIRKWSDRKKKIQVPLFNGYLFVHATDTERVEAIKDTAGALRYIFYQKRPAIVTETEINNIKLSLKAPERFKIEHSNIKKGDTVIVKGGVFEGMQGVVTEFRGNYKLNVNISELSLSLSVVLHASEVKLLENINETTYIKG